MWARETKQLLALLATLALFLGACEYPGVPHPLAVAAAVESGPGAAALPPKAAPPAPAGQGPSPDVLQGTVPMTQRDFKLDPDNITVKAGAVTFVLKNEGRYTHDFRVEGQGIDERGPKVGAGRSIEWRITLPPGEYQISCPVSNHADRGMVGVMTVVP